MSNTLLCVAACDVDFWTTQCTRCPEALDKLNIMASDPKYSNVRFVSICCDKLDGAREIIEKDDEPRWKNVSHYFMDRQHKEEAKKLLGFKSVPFYVILNEDGEITQKGSSKTVDFDAVPGVVRPESDKENQNAEARPTSNESSPRIEAPAMERVFALDEDF